MTTELTISSDLAEARRVQQWIEEALAASAYSAHDIFAAKLVLEEALVNAIKYGNRMDPEKRVRVVVTVTAERYDVRVIAEGEGFDSAGESDPSA